MNTERSELLIPGTQTAIDAGCLCPVVDNEYGRGYMGQPGMYVYAGNCPIHGDRVAVAIAKEAVRR